MACEDLSFEKVGFAPLKLGGRFKKFEVGGDIPPPSFVR